MLARVSVFAHKERQSVACSVEMGGGVGGVTHQFFPEVFEDAGKK